MVNYISLLTHCQNILAEPSEDRYNTMERICSYLQNEVNHYDWVGFYMANHEERTLHLKAFAGIPTDHTVLSHLGKEFVDKLPFQMKIFWSMMFLHKTTILLVTFM